MGLLFKRRGRHYKQRALWKRILLWTAVTLLAFILTVGLAGFIFVYHTLGKIGQDTEVIFEAKQQLDIPLPDEPMNVLVLGADEDPDGTAKRSDTIMLVRVDPDGECLSILSVPRDLIVDIPGVGPDKINSAYAIGGVSLAIGAMRELTELPIHHFVLIDYSGFEQAVDAMGGVYVDVDKRYFNDNSDAPWGEAYEPIDINPGYQRLNGHDALAYVRYRHTDSDFMRITRQQYFIRDAKSQSLKWGNVTKIPELADVFASNTTSDLGRNDILSLTKFMLTVDRDHIYQAQVPIEERYGGYIALASEHFFEVLEKFMSPAFDTPEPQVPGAQPEIPSEETKQMSIEVLNGNGEEGAASLAADMLRKKGFTKIAIGGNARNSYEENQIYFQTGAQAAADELCSLIEPCSTAPMDPGLSNAPLLVVVGSSFEGQLTQPQPEIRSALTFEDNSSAGWDQWRMMSQEMPFPLSRPYSFPLEFDYVEFHNYDISTDDGPKPALKVVCADEAGNAWGIMVTTFTDAPLLENPSAEREISGRQLRFYYSGETLRSIAWQEDGVAYWITNSLQNSLSEDTMIRLAVSFSPV